MWIEYDGEWTEHDLISLEIAIKTLEQMNGDFKEAIYHMKVVREIIASWLE